MPQLRRDRILYRQSLVIVPVLYIAGAYLLGGIAPALDEARGRSAADAAGTARDVLTATATGMIAFTGFVVSGLLVVVQFAAGQYSPRLVLWFRRDRLIKHSIGVFLAAFVFSLVALRRLEGTPTAAAPDITVGLALTLLVASAVLFLALLQRVTDRLRPRTLFAAVAREGARAVLDTYPARHGEQDPPRRDSWASPEPLSVQHAGPPGVLASFNGAALLAAASRAEVVIEVVPSVGEFIGPRQELLRVHGEPAKEAGSLARWMVIATERTIEQDPAFALRIIVDTAIRALSPAINDPTTAVHALDQLEALLQQLAERDLDTGLARDDAGALRLVWTSPGWDSLLSLALDEIRGYGRESIQVCRRLQALLEDLLRTTPAERHPALEEHLERLHSQVLKTFPEGTPERALAQVPDRTGLGHG